MFYVVKVETIGACNRKCEYCKFGVGFENDATLLDWDAILKILSELKKINFSGRLSWFGINEPLLDKRMPEIIKESRKYLPKAFLSLQTNGDLLTLEKLEELHENGLDYMGVSIYDDSTYDKIVKISNDLKGGKRIILKDCRKVDVQSLENRGGSISWLPKKIEYLSRNCLRPSSCLYIDNYGKVKICEGDVKSEITGINIRDYSIEQIWNHKTFEYYKTELAKNGRKNLKLCNSCTYGGFRMNPYFPLRHPDNL